jgi:hypothetical protein
VTSDWWAVASLLDVNLSLVAFHELVNGSDIASPLSHHIREMSIRRSEPQSVWKKLSTICAMPFCHLSLPADRSMRRNQRRLAIVLAPARLRKTQFTASIEKCTLQIPSSAYLGFALASMAVSVDFKIAEKDHMAPFRRSMGSAFPRIGYLQQTREVAWIRHQCIGCRTLHR